LQVVAGRLVTLRLSARAVVPPGFQEISRIVSHDTPAHQAAKHFKKGANLGNGFEVPPGQNWAVRYTVEDIRHIAEEGFDHVRIPVGWHHYVGSGPGFKLEPGIFARVDELVNAALKRGLGVIVNIHHFDEFTTDPEKETPRFLAIWRQLAVHYSKASPNLAFELLNEPRDAATTEVISPIYARAIAGIRKVDSHRVIFVGPGKWNSVSELTKLMLPNDDRNLIVTVHSYDPFYFTHQGATWSGPDTQVTGIIFPGPPASLLVPDPKLELKPSVRDWIHAYNTEPTERNPSGPKAFLDVIKEAKEWSEYYGRPIHFGEFGAFTKADAQSRARYYRAFREAAEQAGIGWAIWDWRAGFHYWNEATDQPEPGMHRALFGSPATAKSGVTIPGLR
jgi:endoglucanase